MTFPQYTGNGGHTITPSSKYPHDSLEASMTRTFCPRYANYMGDGSGRDSYVIVNNGGLTNSDKRAMCWRNTRMPQNHQASPRKEAVSHTYISDGSGRDSYVLHNSGGLVHDWRCGPSESVFKANLRNNPQP